MGLAMELIMTPLVQRLIEGRKSNNNVLRDIRHLGTKPSVPDEVNQITPPR